MKRFLPILLALLTSCLSALAGGGPTGCVVIFNPADANSVTVAVRYQQVRGIPERNMVAYVFPTTFTRTTAWDFVYSLRQTLAARGIDGQVQCLALAGVTPLSGSQSTPTGNIFSTHSFLFLSPSYSQASFPTSIFFTSPAYTQPASFRGPAPTGTRALTAATAIGGKNFWPVSSVGFPGKSGTSPRETLGLIERAKLHDAAKPDGTIYWPLNSDIRSTTRENEIDDVAEVWRARGLRSWITGNGTIFNTWVTNRADIVGGVVGLANFTAGAGNTYLPGAWVDHLTSSGGAWDSFNPSQTTTMQWLRAGADGSSGTMTEPYAYAQKFPHAHIHTHFRAGASLAEAFWQSIVWPAEIVCVGDPLLQPFADFPAVNVSAPANGATVSGTMAIAATAAATGGKILEANLDLFVDGRRVAIGAAGEPVGAARTAGGFSLNTATLGDGWHDLRVVAYNSDAVRTQNEARLTVSVSNAGDALTLTGPASVNPDGTANFSVTRAGLADLTALSLQANGRTLAALPVTGGTVAVNLAASASLAPLDGSWTLFAVGTRASGQQIFSAPFTTGIAWPAMPATASPSLGGAMAGVRFFYDTSATGFDWDAATPDVVATFPGDATHGLYITPANIPGINITDYTAMKPGYQLDCWFLAPVDDWYEIGFDFPNGAYSQLRSAALDGQVLVERNFAFQPRHLAPGWHSLRVRAALNNSLWASWKLRVRGGASQDFAALNRATCSNSGTGAPADSPTIVSVASANPVAGTTVALTANATIGGGTPAELAGLTYYWMLVSGPENVTFSANATNAASTTTATFTGAGDYLFGLRVTGPAGSATATRALTVARTPNAALSISAGLIATVLRGEALTAICFSRDQFTRRIDVTAINPALPTMQWSTNDPAGAFTPLSANGERVSFRSLSAVSAAQTFTLTATGVNGRAGTASVTVTVNPNSAPTQNGARLFTILQSGAGQPVQFTATVNDPENSQGRYLTFSWSVLATPPGQTLTLTSTGYKTTQGAASGPGAYTVRLDVTDQAGEALSDTQTFGVDAAGVATSPPNPGTPASQTVKVGETATFFVAAIAGAAAQWQSSANGGASWQDLAGATGNALDFGPVIAADTARLFRIRFTNAAGSSTSAAATLTVNDPAGGAIGFVAPTLLAAPESAGSVNIVVRRSGQSTGAVSVTATLSDGDATLGADYLGFDGESQTVATLSWPAGDNTDRALTVPVVNDAVAETTEEFYVSLSNVQGGAVLSSAADFFVDLEDDDGPGTASLLASAATVRERDGSAVLTVRRTGPFVGTLSVNFAAASGTAVAGQDFTATSGTLTWPGGDTTDRQIVVPLTNDGAIEGDETFTVTLSAADSALLGGIVTTAVTIQDSPYEKWQQLWFPGAIPVVPAYSQTITALRAFAPVFLFRFSETSGTSVAGVDAAGAIVATGALSGSFTLGQPGPRPSAWPGLESANTALVLNASGSTGVPPQHSAGASANTGTANALAPRLRTGFTFSAWVKTSVTDRMMNLIGAARTGVNTAFSVFLNRAYNNSTTTVAHALRIFLRAETTTRSLDYSVVFSALPTGSLCDGQWHHIVISVPAFTSADNADYPRFYFDGIEANAINVRGVETITNTETFTDFSDIGLRLGANGNTSPGTYFGGAFDEVAVFPRVLTPTEVARIATAGPLAAPPAFTSLGADYDADGLRNQLEYALALNPLFASVFPPALGFVQVGAESYLAITYTENVNATDMTKTVEVSGDLTQWNSGPAFTTLVNSSIAGSVRTLTVRDNIPYSASARRFIRVKVATAP